MNQESRKTGKSLRDSEITQQIGEHRLDFFVEGKIVVELKAVSKVEDIHFEIGRSYLKAASLEDGLLFNFATTPLTIKRFCRERAGRHRLTFSHDFPISLLS